MSVCVDKRFPAVTRWRRRSTKGLTFTDMGAAVNSYAEQLSDGEDGNGEADVIVVLVHDGASSTALASADGTPYGDLVAQADPNIDAIVSGHTHQLYTHDVDGTWVTQSAQYGEQLGRLTFTVDRATGEVTAATAENVDLVPVPGDPRANPPVPRVTFCQGDPEVQAVVDAAVVVANELGSVPLGGITGDINRAVQADGTENRGGESTLGNLVADVQLWAAQRTNPSAQIAFMNPGGLRANMTYAQSGTEGDGVLTFREAAVVQPFANTLVTTVLTGSQLASVLEEQWQPAGASRPFLKLGISDAFRYTYDPDAPAGSRILGMWLDGVPIDPAAQYTVVANSFLASGGDNFRTLGLGAQRQDTGQSDLTAMVDYLAEFGSVSPDVVQRSIGVNWVSDPTATLAPGDEVAFALSSLAFSTTEPKPAEVSVTLGGVALGTFPVDLTVVSTTDEVGRASVTAAVPDGLDGEVELVVSDAVNGVVHSTTVTVQGEVGDTIAPSVTIRPGTSYTRGGPAVYELISFAMADEGGLDRYVLNGRPTTLAGASEATLNRLEPGVRGAVEGVNTLVVYDLAENETTVTFTLEEPEPVWQPWLNFAKWLWGLLKVLFPWWPWP